VHVIPIAEHQAIGLLGLTARRISVVVQHCVKSWTGWDSILQLSWFIRLRSKLAISPIFEAIAVVAFVLLCKMNFQWKRLFVPRRGAETPGRKQLLLEWLRLSSQVLCQPRSSVGWWSINDTLGIAEYFAAWLVSVPCAGVRPSLRSRPGMPPIKAQRTWTSSALADLGLQARSR